MLPRRASYRSYCGESEFLLALLRDVSGYSGRPVTRAALSLSAMLLLRPGELRAMEWAWLDVGAAHWKSLKAC